VKGNGTLAAVENPACARIVTRAREHFFAHGFRGVTMDDLAAELGMSKKTLYAHFPGKSALLEAVLLAKFTEVEADLAGVTSRPTAPFPTALHDLLTVMQRHTLEIQPPFVRDMQRESPETFRLVETRRRELIGRHFGKLFEQGRKAGVIRKDLPAQLIIELLLGAVGAIMNPPKMQELGLTPTAGFSAIIDIVIRGIVTESGRKEI